MVPFGIRWESRLGERAGGKGAQYTQVLPTNRRLGKDLDRGVELHGADKTVSPKNTKRCASLLPQGTMPVERMRMRPWLEEQINSNTIPGLKWLNKVGVLGMCAHVCMSVFVLEGNERPRERGGEEKKEKRWAVFLADSVPTGLPNKISFIVFIQETAREQGL